MEQNIVWQNHPLTEKQRSAIKGHPPAVVWFTGLSGAGKSTLAGALEQALHEKGIHTYLLDGDNIRHGLSKGLGFSPEDRKENLRRIGEVARLMTDAGLVVLSAFVSPYKEDRNQIRSLFRPGFFTEVYVHAPLEECERRDTKGLYKKARAGLIPAFTGISDPYEVPENPEVTVNTVQFSPQECIAEILNYLDKKGLFDRLQVQ